MEMETSQLLFSDPPDQPKVSMVGDPYVRAGDNVTLACVVTGGNPPPDVSWYLKDRLLSARFQYDLQTQVGAIRPHVAIEMWQYWWC